MKERPTAEDASELLEAVLHFFRIGVQRGGEECGNEIAEQVISNRLKEWSLQELPQELKARIEVGKQAILAKEQGRPTDAEKERNRSDFIRLWTAASAARNYDKAAWMAAERQLLAADLI